MSDEVKEIAGAVHQLKSALKFIKKNWAIFAFFGSFIITGAGSLVNLWYSHVVEPEMTSFVRNVAGKYAQDSLPNFIDNHLSTKGGGFRGGLSGYIDARQMEGFKKSDVVPTIGNIILNEDSLKASLNEVRAQSDYSRAIGNLLIAEMFKDSIDNGIKLKVAPSGDTYYLDSLNIPWACVYKHRLGKWVFYPPYNSNKQTFCK